MVTQKVQMEDGRVATVIIKTVFKPKSDYTQKKYQKRKKRIKPAKKNR